jgi:predicted nuclease of predicted toxin-antitoxin system
VAELAPAISDEQVLERANREQALLLTADKDFGELVYRQRRAATGIVLLRLAGLPAERKAELTSAAFAEHGNELTG